VIFGVIGRKQEAESRKQKLESRKWRVESSEKSKRGSSTAQADAFVPQTHPGRKRRAGAKAEEKVGLLRSVPQNHSRCRERK